LPLMRISQTQRGCLATVQARVYTSVPFDLENGRQ
jgi:hypothetical protein